MARLATGLMPVHRLGGNGTARPGAEHDSCGERFRGNGCRSARVKITGDVKGFARETERDLNAALAGLRTRDINVGLDVDRNGLEKTAAQFAKLGTEAATEATEGFSKGLSGLSSAINSNPYLAAAGAILGAGLALSALPALGTALSGALFGGAGLA
jgi:hypothetical protein